MPIGLVFWSAQVGAFFKPKPHPAKAGCTPIRRNQLPRKQKSILVMDAKTVERALIRIAHEIVEKNKGAENMAVIGIKNRGEYLAQRVARLIEKIEKVQIPVGLMDITLYRDDIQTKLEQPLVQKTEILFDVVER